MYLTLGEAENATLAARNYGVKYPNRRHPSGNVIKRLRKNRAPPPNQKGILPEKPCTRDTVDTERLLGISFKTVNRVIRDDQLHPYHYIKVQTFLVTEDRIVAVETL